MSDRYLRQLLREARQGLVPLQDYVAAALRVMSLDDVIASLEGFSVDDIRLAVRLVWIPTYAGISKETKARVALAIALEAGETDFPDYTLFEQNQPLLSDSEWRLFAADCAERVLHNFESEYPNDTRPRKAIEAARRFARGEATAQQLAAAWSAASYAARSASMSAARSAAWFVAESAARNAAWSATQQAEIAWQASRLSDYLVDLGALPPLVDLTGAQN